MVEMKSRIFWTSSSRPAAIRSRGTVWATEIVTPPMRISVKKSWARRSQRPALCGPGNAPQRPGQL